MGKYPNYLDLSMIGIYNGCLKVRPFTESKQWRWICVKKLYTAVNLPPTGQRFEKPMPLTEIQADQIATLLNERNQLTVKYNRKRVLDSAENYLCRYSETREVIACVEIKRVQWYQAEVLHLTVAKDHERKGHAKALLCEAERLARTKGARLLQCTIRRDNEGSSKLFEAFGFLHISTFLNEDSGNNVRVFQKVLAAAR